MTKPIKINVADIERRMAEAMKEKNIVCNELLGNIKARRTDLESIRSSLINLEPELVYRFYHQSFKVFWFMESIEQAKKLLSGIAPEGQNLNSWFVSIVDSAIEAEFNDETTNKNWLEETRPILEALWHCKYFVEQAISAADSLGESPMVLPYDWAAVLYLYNLR